MTTRTPNAKQGAPAAVRTGPCTAVRRGGTCACDGFRSPITVDLYRQCACGHTQQVHALSTAAAAA